MTYILEMSTDGNIVKRQVSPKWTPIDNRYSWRQVIEGHLQMPDGVSIVVMANCDGARIGNQQMGTVEVRAELFLSLIQHNMIGGAIPSSIFLSVGTGAVDDFCANVWLNVYDHPVWMHTQFFVHQNKAKLPVPSIDCDEWTEIYTPSSWQRSLSLSAIGN